MWVKETVSGAASPGGTPAGHGRSRKAPFGSTVMWQQVRLTLVGGRLTLVANPESGR
jgi:hypothetical protein